MGQVQGPSLVLLYAPVQRLDTLTALAIGRVLGELEACAAESILLLEDRLVRDCNLDSLELVAIKARGILGELEDLAPSQVVALDVVGVEQSVAGIERCGCTVDWDTTIEDDGALDIRAGILVGHCERGARDGGERKESLGVHFAGEGETELEAGCVVSQFCAIDGYLIGKMRHSRSFSVLSSCKSSLIAYRAPAFLGGLAVPSFR